MILFATGRSVRKEWVGRVLRAALLDNLAIAINPSRLCHAVSAMEPDLVLIDGRSKLSWETMAEARLCGPHTRFVLCLRSVTPAVVRTAMECGLDGVVSTSLPVEEAAVTLQGICRGERHLRFEATPRREAQQAAAPAADFDTFWMFGAAQGS